MQMALRPTPEQNLAALGFALPQLPIPGANYVSAKQVGPLLYLSGVISMGPESVITGTAGLDRSAEAGYSAARACALAQLAVIKRELGSLDNVAEIISVTGFVKTVPGFAEVSAVTNGASDLLVQVFGEEGRHVRTSVGVNSLPRNALVEIQMIVRTIE
jgi:enamine deaminase RidA (YjgF/YER057c/UK114 family)